MSGKDTNVRKSSGRTASSLLQLNGSPLLLALVAALFLFLTLEYLSPRFFLWDDNATFYLPWYLFDYRSVVGEGTVPLVNFHQYCGQPYLAQGQRGIFYPVVYFAVWVAQEVMGNFLNTMDVFIIAHFLAGTAAMYGLCKAFGIRPWLAAMCGLVYVTLPFFLISAKSWVQISCIFLYLPLTQLLVERLLDRGTLARIALLALAKALFFWQGYFEFVLYVFFFEVLFIIGRRVVLKTPFRRRFLLDYVWANLHFIVLVLPDLLTFMSALHDSAIRSLPLPMFHVLRFAVEPRNFIRAQLFDFSAEAFFRGTTQIYFVGFLLFLPITIAWSYLRKKPLSRHVVLFLLFALFAFLISTRLRIILAYLPLFDRIRWPFKTFSFFAFYALLGFGTLLEQMLQFQILRKGTVVAVLAVTCCLNLVAIFPITAERAFGPYRLDSLEPEMRSVIKSGRVLSYGLIPEEPRNARLATFAFPTLFQLYGLAGYDPLRSFESYQVGLGLSHSSVYAKPLDQDTLDHMTNWSVRYLITENNESAQQDLVRWPQLAEVFKNAQNVILENKVAKPYAFFEDAPQRALPVTFAANRITIATGNKTGPLRVTVVPMAGYRILTDNGQSNDSLAAQEGQLVITKKSETPNIVVEYHSTIFDATWWVPLIGLAGVLLAVFPRKGKLLS